MTRRDNDESNNSNNNDNNDDNDNRWDMGCDESWLDGCTSCGGCCDLGAAQVDIVFIVIVIEIIIIVIIIKFFIEIVI